jgi:hypothetical protein
MIAARVADCITKDSRELSLSLPSQAWVQRIA